MDYMSSSRSKEENERFMRDDTQEDFHGFPNPSITSTIKIESPDTSSNDSEESDFDEEVDNFNGGYICDCCRFSFPSKYKLLEHFSSKNKSFKCIDCGLVCKTLKEFDTHRKIHTENKCKICHESFKTPLTLVRHSLIHTELRKQEIVKENIKNRFKCPSCDMVFKSENIYGLHLTVHSNPLFICSVCDKGFKEKRLLTAHMQVHSVKKMHKCNICQKPFKRAADLKLHSAVHSNERPYRCNQCDKSYKILGELTKHMDKKHIKNFLCKQCDVTYDTRSALRAHEKTHVISCEYCKKIFKNHSLLKRHSVVHSDRRVYRCAICSQTYKTGLTLSQHLLTHSDARNYECTICDKKFKRRTTLNEHELSHLDKSLLPDKNRCPQCGKGFYAQKDLRKHIQAHESNKYFVCNICHKTFRKSVNLDEHKRKSHSSHK